MEKEYIKHHWSFWEDDGAIECYEQRDGDVIGGFYDITFDELKDKIKDMSEDELYGFICYNIEWY